MEALKEILEQMGADDIKVTDHEVSFKWKGGLIEIRPNIEFGTVPILDVWADES